MTSKKDILKEVSRLRAEIRSLNDRMAALERKGYPLQPKINRDDILKILKEQMSTLTVGEDWFNRGDYLDGE